MLIQRISHSAVYRRESRNRMGRPTLLIFPQTLACYVLVRTRRANRNTPRGESGEHNNPHYRPALTRNAHPDQDAPARRRPRLPAALLASCSPTLPAYTPRPGARRTSAAQRHPIEFEPLTHLVEPLPRGRAGLVAPSPCTRLRAAHGTTQCPPHRRSGCAIVLQQQRQRQGLGTLSGRRARRGLHCRRSLTVAIQCPTLRVTSRK